MQVLRQMRPLEQSRNVFVALSLLVFFATVAQSQTIQWASEVLDVSSEKQVQTGPHSFSKHAYRAEQALGKPNKCPATGDSPCAWAPANDYDQGAQEEFIKVGFDRPMKIMQVAIAQNYYPGAVEKVIRRVTGRDATGILVSGESEVLVRFADFLRQHTREDDRVTRIGGEEFLLILRDIPRSALERTLDALRRGIAALALRPGLQLTASFGGVHAMSAEATAEDLVAAADDLMYAAKHGGRNCSFVHNGAATNPNSAVPQNEGERAESLRAAESV